MSKITLAVPSIKRVIKTILATSAVIGVLIIVAWVVSYISYWKVKKEIIQTATSSSNQNKSAVEEYPFAPKEAKQEGKSPEQFALENLLENPADYSTSTLNGRLTYLLSYQVDWGSVSESIVAVVQGSKILWKDHIGGMGGVRYVDINGDGIDEIEANTDGGGNRPACYNMYYRWTRNSQGYEAVKFKGGDNDYDAIDCGKGLIDINNDGIYEYKSLTWRNMYPEIYSQYITNIENAPKEAFLCEQVMTTYRYDGENFVIADEKIIEDNIDGTKNMRTCMD